MFSQFKQKAIYLGLALTIILLLFALFAYLAGVTRSGSTVFFIGIGIGVGWGITWLLSYVTITRPLASLASASEALITKDGLALSDALASLAQGNLTARANLDGQFNRAEWLIRDPSAYESIQYCYCSIPGERKGIQHSYRRTMSTTLLCGR